MLSKPKTCSGQSKSLKVWFIDESVKNPTVGKKSQDQLRIFRSGWQSLYLLLWPLLHKTCLNVGRNHSWLKFPQSPQAVQQSLLQPRTYGAFDTHSLSTISTIWRLWHPPYQVNNEQPRWHTSWERAILSSLTIWGWCMAGLVLSQP